MRMSTVAVSLLGCFNGRGIMRYLTILAGVALLYCTSALSARPNDVNFSGNWKFDSATSVGGYVTAKNLRILPRTLKINQNYKKLVIDGFLTDPNDGSSLMEKMAFRLDGRKSLNDNDSLFNVSHAKWSDNGNKLTISTKTTRIIQDRQYSYKEIEILSLKNGNLVVDVKYDNPYSERKYEAVYDKATS